MFPEVLFAGVVALIYLYIDKNLQVKKKKKSQNQAGIVHVLNNEGAIFYTFVAV